MDMIVMSCGAYYGPFKNPQAARTWAEANCAKNGWALLPLFAPTLRLKPK